MSSIPTQTTPTATEGNPPTHTAAIRVEHLSHIYPATPARRACAPHRANRLAAAPDTLHPIEPNQPALNDISLVVEPGEVFAILGPNGGGKTTLFRILSTLLRPTHGRVSVFGYDVPSQPRQVRRRLGVVFQMPSLDVKLTARENILHQGHLYGLKGRDLLNRVDRLLDQAGLLDKAHARVETFSGGMRRRVELAKAMLHEPPLLLLDEPSTGLDVAARRDLWDTLQQLRDTRGVTIAMTTHLMDEADRCDRLAVLDRGRLVALDTPSDLKTLIGGDVVTIEPLACGAGELAREITERFGPWDGERTKPKATDGIVRFERPDGPTFVATLAQSLPGKIQSVTVGRPTLEDVFMHLTGRSL